MPASPVRLRIKARDVIIATERPQNLSALNVLSGRVRGIENAGGALVDVRIDCLGQPVIARITRQSAEGLGLAVGLAAFAIVKSVSFDPASLARMAPARPDRVVSGKV